MKRRLFPFFSMASLLLLVCVIGLQILALLGTRKYFIENHGWIWSLGISQDHAWLTGVSGWPAGTKNPEEEVFISRSSVSHDVRLWGCWGDSGRADAVTHDGRFRSNGRYLNVAFDFWLAAILFAVMPAFWLAIRLHERRLRRREGRFCNRCRYDLTGNVTGVCPECGAGLTARVNQVSISNNA